MKRIIGITCLLGWCWAAGAAEPAAPAQEKPQAAAAEDLGATAGPRVNTSSPNVSPVGGTQPGPKDKPVGPDQLELDTTIVTGNRELPKVLYIVPWKKADLGELPQPFNSLLDEVLTPLDRDVFRREVNYYGVITGKADAPGATPGATAQQQTAPEPKPRQ